MNHCFEVAVVETGDEFSIVYIFITIFVNNVYPKFYNVSHFVVQWSNSETGYLNFFHIFINSFLKTETKVIINIYTLYFLVGKTNGYLAAVCKIASYHCKKPEWLLGYSFQIFCFVGKNGWPFGCNFENFAVIILLRQDYIAVGLLSGHNTLYWFYANGEKVRKGDWRWYPR